MSIRILSEDELRQAVPADRSALLVVEEAFKALAAGRVEMPPILHISIANPPGDVDVKGAYIEGFDNLAIKVGAGFFNNRLLGLPNSSAMMVMINSKTGRCSAILLDNAYLTDLRTGLAGGVAARHLVPDRTVDVAIVGAGVQARFQLAGLALVRDIGRVEVTARRPEQVEATVEDMRSNGFDAYASASIENAVRAADVILTTTASAEPLIDGDWLRPGQHVTAVGSDLPGKRELAISCLERVDRIVCDLPTQCRTHGELQELPDDSPVLTKVISLGSVVSGIQNGRRNDQEITIADLTGLGIQDTAIGSYALERCGDSGFLV